ncbi:calmodulin-A-like [Teleopsis dalmanni]|uniref:calmodulin-A-like n=1 Tax=Teleopsis dalmanni TaxID=139649 RepID=UPI0018CF7616|nr:calmodulin-A-like [Teleopsis dalmanni]
MSHDKLSRAEYKIFQDTFTYFDKDDDGFIGKQQILKIFQMLGHNPSKEFIDDLAVEFDAEGKGFNFENFLAMFTRMLGNETEEEVRDACKAFFKKGQKSTLIDVEYFRHFMTYKGAKLTDEEVEKALEHVFITEEKQFDPEELVQALSQIKLDDPDAEEEKEESSTDDENKKQVVEKWTKEEIYEYFKQLKCTRHYLDDDNIH